LSNFSETAHHTEILMPDVISRVIINSLTSCNS